MLKYYIDTSIWMDIYEDRKGYNNEPLGDYGLKLFAQLKARRFKLIITELIITELLNYYSVAEINGMMNPFEEIIEKIKSTKKQGDEAIKIANERKVPYGDVLHTIIARDNNFILVTRDKHFKQLRDISQHYKPEDLI